ncbi:MAG TPA: response regulator, partial [Deltaproteobacteria bacterium]|nr:response regulator [Deltaproteobacteria bacterium]
MNPPERPRILIVDDEEAILETMTFTFMDLYDVLTTSDPKEALSILEENDPVAVVITDQRMPGMTGVELLKQVYERHPETVRIILTGFADTDATIQAINDGHIYGYINKPWEPDELKTIVRHAVELHALAVENRRLVEDLRNANAFLAAVMDRLRTGAIAVDRDGIVRAV